MPRMKKKWEKGKEKEKGTNQARWKRWLWMRAYGRRW
jgi:hypothetical protein